MPELWFARLGEYDIRTTEDGPHQDVEIADAIPHEHYHEELVINDIAIIHLMRDIEFTG